MPCPNCPVDKLSSKGGCSWECCYCKQGYNSYRYDTSCTNCGHGGPSASTGLDTVPTEIDVRQVEAQQPDPHPRVDLSLFPKRENEMALLPPDPEARKDGILSNKEVSASTPRHTVESRDELPTKLLPVLDELQHKSPEESSTTSAVSILELSEETEDNSNTDYSDTELTGVRTVREYIRDRARNLVDHLMKNLRFEFDFDTAIIRCTSGQTNESANSSSQPPSSNVGGATVLEPARRTKIRKVREGEKDNSDDESEKKPPKRRKGKSKVESPPLACLFFKRNPRLCTRNRCCSETGWVTIHRLREHLDRCHRVFQCPCCYLAFLKKEKLKAHLDSPSACSPRSNIHVFGLNEEKLKLVREKLQSKTPEEMWRELYRRIFPEISPESVPSPYFDGKAPETVDDGYYSDIADAEEFYEELKNNLPYRTLCLLREAYERDLTFAAYRGIGKLQELINTQDFETKLQDCMKLALDEFRSHFLMAHLTTGTTAELNNTCPATAPKSLLQDEHSAAIGDFPNNETGSSSSAYMNNIAPQPNDWNIETNLDYDFPIEEAFQDWNWDILNCPPPETVSKDDIECLAAQSEIKMVTDNLTLDFPEPFNLTETIPPLDLHAPNLSKRELSYNNDEKARAAAARMAADT